MSASALGVVLTCEHASWAPPADVELGVAPEVLRSQAGWDHGAHDIALGLGAALDLPVRAGTLTRLFVDLNRPPDHADVVPAVCYGAAVPANRGLDAAARHARLVAFHAPYWDAVERDVRAGLAAHGGVLHISSHSFSPALDPARRTFDCGVLFDPSHPFEAAIAERLIAALAAAGLAVRANQPYDGVGPALCTSLRTALAPARYAGIALEASHALTESRGGCARMAAALAPAIAALMAGR